MPPVADSFAAIACSPSLQDRGDQAAPPFQSRQLSGGRDLVGGIAGREAEAGQPQAHGKRHKPLLGPVVKVPLDASAFGQAAAEFLFVGDSSTRASFPCAADAVTRYGATPSSTIPSSNAMTACRSMLIVQPGRTSRLSPPMNVVIGEVTSASGSPTLARPEARSRNRHPAIACQGDPGSML